MGKNVENEPPVTVPDLIMSAATKYSHYLAIGSKYKKSWQLLTYIEYYEACRRAAKAFLKVLHVRTPPAALPAGGMGRCEVATVALDFRLLIRTTKGHTCH